MEPKTGTSMGNDVHEGGLCVATECPQLSIRLIFSEPRAAGDMVQGSAGNPGAALWSRDVGGDRDASASECECDRRMGER